MKTKYIVFILLASLFPLISSGDSKQTHESKYAGQEKREIKSLSESDIEELSKGKGWGFAKAAELNGVPGPVHLLEMKQEINLTADQIKKIEALFQKMKNQAIPLGLKFIELERELNRYFADNSITEEKLQQSLEKIAQVRKQLRYVHLSTHLKTPSIISKSQINLYNKLRGYASDDSCEKIPKGHDPEMWKQHHSCP